jgi:hypothetical protein
VEIVAALRFGVFETGKQKCKMDISDSLGSLPVFVAGGSIFLKREKRGARVFKKKTLMTLYN